MKVGVMSDTHLKEIDDDFIGLVERYFSDVSAIIHAGDLCHISVAEYLSGWADSINAELVIVSGNMDVGTAARNLPGRRVAELGGKKIGVIHGWGSPQGLEERVIEEFSGIHLDAVVYGHSHAPSNRIANGMIAFNPGSPTDRRFARENTIGYLIIDDNITGEIVPV